MCPSYNVNFQPVSGCWANSLQALAGTSALTTSTLHQHPSMSYVDAIKSIFSKSCRRHVLTITAILCWTRSFLKWTSAHERPVRSSPGLGVKCVRPQRCPRLSMSSLPHESPIIAVAFSVEKIGSDSKKKIRRGEDWRRSGRTVLDQPFHHTPDHFASLGVLASSVHPRTQLDGDMTRTQLPLDNPEVAYLLLITPEGPTLWNHNVLLLRSAASVWSYNRFGDIMRSISRVLIFSPVLHYVDDYGSMEPNDTAQSSFESFEEFNGALGFTMKPSKRQAPFPHQRMQGVIIESYSDTIILSPRHREPTTCADKS